MGPLSYKSCLQPPHPGASSRFCFPARRQPARLGVILEKPYENTAELSSSPQYDIVPSIRNQMPRSGLCLSSPNAQRHTNTVERACMCESKLISNLLREMRMRTEGEGGGDQWRSQSVDVRRISQKEVPISDWSPGPTKICRPEASGNFTACSSHAC